MTKQVWQVERFATDVTNQIESLQYFTGRRTQFDSWAPGSLVFTIHNDNGEANGYDLNDKIILTAVGTSFYQWLYVQEVLFDDRGGDGGGSSATIVCTLSSIVSSPSPDFTMYTLSDTLWRCTRPRGPFGSSTLMCTSTLSVPPQSALTSWMLSPRPGSSGTRGAVFGLTMQKPTVKFLVEWGRAHHLRLCGPLFAPEGCEGSRHAFRIAWLAADGLAVTEIYTNIEESPRRSQRHANKE